MRSAALIAVLLGIATLTTAEAHAAPSVSATITIKQGTVQVAGRHGHHGYRRGPAPHRHHSLARHRRHHRPAYTQRFHRAPVVIVRPARRSPPRYWPSRPPVRQGFALHDYHW